MGISCLLKMERHGIYFLHFFLCLSFFFPTVLNIDHIKVVGKYIQKDAT